MYVSFTHHRVARCTLWIGLCSSISPPVRRSQGESMPPSSSVWCATALPFLPQVPLWYMPQQCRWDPRNKRPAREPYPPLHCVQPPLSHYCGKCWLGDCCKHPVHWIPLCILSLLGRHSHHLFPLWIRTKGCYFPKERATSSCRVSFHSPASDTFAPAVVLALREIP